MRHINGIEIIDNARVAVATEALSGNKTLTISDYIIQWLDPNGSDRDITLPAEASSINLMFIILNTANGAGEDLVIKNDTPATIATLGPGQCGMFSCDGTNWKWEDAVDYKLDTIAQQTIFPQVNDAATPTVAFGDGDTGFYESDDDKISITLNGARRWIISDTTIESATNYGARIARAAATATLPAVTFRTDANTGMGLAADDQLSLIAGGVEGQRITEFGSKPYTTIGGIGIADLTACTFLTATKTQISKTGVGTNLAIGDLVYVTGGTNATVGAYRATTIDSADLITVDRDIHAEGTDITDGTVSTIKDAVLVSPTDGTNGQRIMGYSHQNKPLQIGGDTLLSPTYVANTGQSPDIQIGRRLILPQVDEAATPTLAFGDGDTGFYEESDDNISVAIGGGRKWTYGIAEFKGNVSSSAILLNETATDTNPVHAIKSDTDTGIGSADADQLSLIAGGVEGIRITENGTCLTNIKSPSALTSTVLNPAKITHYTSGTPATGIGVGIEFEQETADDNNEILATIEAIATDVTGASEEGALSLKVMVAGAAATEALKVDSSVVAGDTRLLLYDVDNATVERVTVGAAESGGAGFKVLRIPN